MKKWLLIVLTLCAAVLLTGCACKHEQTEVRDVLEPQCVVDGYTGNTYCLECEEVVTEGEAITATGHVEGRLWGNIFASCTVNGYTGDKLCLVCGGVMEEGEVIPMTGHNYVFTGAKEATCNEPGHTGYEICENCGDVPDAGKIISQLPHTLGDLQGASEATCTEDGSTGYRECTVCGYRSASTPVSATGHNMVNNVCETCGYREAGLVIDGELAFTWQELLDAGYIKEKDDVLTYVASSLYGELVIREGIKAGISEDYNTTLLYGSQLNVVYVPESLTKLKDMFVGAKKLEAVYLPDTLTGIGSGFRGCSSLKRIEIPDGVEKFGSSVFSKCSSLEEIKLPSKLTWISDGAFSGCSSLMSIDLPDSLTWLGYNVFRGSGITELILPAGLETMMTQDEYGKDSKITRIDASAAVNLESIYLYGMYALTEVILPDTMTVINKCFWDAKVPLEHLTLPNQLTKIDDYFGDPWSKNAKYLKSVVWPVSLIEGKVLADCPNLETIFYCGTEMQWNLTVGHEKFDDCNIIFEYVP